MDILDEKAEAANPQLPLVLRECHDRQGLEIEVCSVKDDETSAGLDVLRVIRPLREVAGNLSGSGKNQKTCLLFTSFLSFYLFVSF